MVQAIARGNFSWSGLQTVIFDDGTYEYQCLAPIWVPQTQTLFELVEWNGRQIIREEILTWSIMRALNNDLPIDRSIRGSFQCNATDLWVVSWYDYAYTV